VAAVPEPATVTLLAAMLAALAMAGVRRRYRLVENCTMPLQPTGGSYRGKLQAAAPYHARPNR
jgi:hypothetical protein